MPSISDIRNDVQKLAAQVNDPEVRLLALFVERLCKMVQDIDHKADDALNASL
jgi:hypothetical protein